MAAGPEDPLARMARWDALRRRVESTGSSAATPQPAPEPPPAPGPPPATGGHSAPAGTTGAAGAAGSPIAELAAATRRVVEQYPSTSVMITIRTPSGTSSVRVAQVDGQVTVSVTDAGSSSPSYGEPRHRTPEPPAEPEPSGGQITARLAELLRQDPTLLSRPE